MAQASTPLSPDVAYNVRGIAPVNVKRAFDNARVNISSFVETIWSPLYDKQTVANGTTFQSFFQRARGASGVTPGDTNMVQASQLPKGQAFLITGVQVELFPTTKPATAIEAQTFANIVYDFYTSGHLLLTIGSKNYVDQAPLMKFPPVNRLYLESAIDTSAAPNGVTYAAAAGREFSVVPMLLESSQNFSVTLSELPTLGEDVIVNVSLNGQLYRNAQ
jgi:hypothetical protein